jgi:hypothetical protein
LQQSARAQRLIADNEPGPKTDAARELVRFGLDGRADLNLHGSKRKLCAKWQAEPRQQRRIGGSAVDVALSSERLCERQGRLERDHAIEGV